MTQGNRHRARARVGETIVIVTSILLAFTIDALWAQRQLRDEERDVLAGLAEEFATNIEQVDRVLARHESSKEWVERLMALPEDSIRALSQTSISEMMLATGNPWTFDPVLGTTDALVAAGRLVVVRDIRLREALTAFKNVVSDSEEDADFLRSFAVEIWKAQVPHGGPWTDPETEIGHLGPVNLPNFIQPATAQDLLNVRSDRTHAGMVGLFHLNAGYYMDELRRIRDQVSTIVALLEESR